MIENESESGFRKKMPEKRTLGVWGLTAATALLGLTSFKESLDLIALKRQGEAVWNTSVPAEHMEIWISENNRIELSEKHKKAALSVFLMFGTWISARTANKLEQNKR